MASIYAMTASDGTVIERYDYGDPFYGQGSPIAYDAATGLPIITSVTTNNDQPPSISGIGTRHFFTGRIFEPLAGVSVSSGSTTGGTLAGRGIYEYRHRWLDPDLGRFMQRDPLGYHDSMNLYQAFMTSPGRYSDPMGLLCSIPDNEWFGRGNCYRYACDDPTSMPSEDPRPEDGLPCVTSCSEIRDHALRDGMLEPIELDGPVRPSIRDRDFLVICPPGSTKVAFAITNPLPRDVSPNGCNDFHWYRQQPDGSWKDKPGDAPVRITPGDPADIDRGLYVVFCGYLCVPVGMDVDD